jgi:pimeloyl-ACP methyl ester carboxylesterase
VAIDDVLLVHGAWHGAGCWDRVLEPLRRHGLTPHTIDLPGHGESSDPPGDLHGDADAVRAALDAIDAPTLLVGHSYGGMVITDAGTHPGAAALVYLCAFMPAAGRSLSDEGPSQPLPEDETPNEPAPVTLTDDGSLILFDTAGAAAMLYNDCDEPTQQWATERLDPQPTASFFQAARSLAYDDTPSTYVVCADDHTIHPWNQRRMAARAQRVIEIDASHSPFLSMPEQLADLLAGEAAR